MNTLSRKLFCGIVVFCIATAVTVPAQVFTKMHNFTGTEGANPYTALVQGINGNLYGTTIDGGAYGYGNVFGTNAAGELVSIYSFCSQSNCIDGENPAMPLVVGSDGNFYGTASNGGSNGAGTVFKITPTGQLTTLHNFNIGDGASPYSALVLGIDGNFYGTTNLGGSSGFGTLFKITAGGNLTTLYNFCSQLNCADGEFPVGGLIQGSDGNIYGTTHAGGNTTCHDGCGTVFRITTSGKLTTLHSFNQADGMYPYGGVVQGADGALYGTTGGGGANSSGTVFTVDASGHLATLHSFDGTDGSSPYAISVGSDGNFYGTTAQGGTFGVYGTIFEITSGGAFTTLHNFDVSDGALVYSGLMQSTNGSFYGTTYFGGNRNDGTVFSLNNNLDPFVSFVRASGRIGQTAGILGQGFTGATSVTFNGTSAKFSVVSNTLLLATVPKGASTGYVEVSAVNSNLKSAVPFVIFP